MHRFPPRLLLVALAVVVALPPPAVRAQSGGRYFPETGHTLEAQFVEFFDRNGGIPIFGFPITDGFRDPSTDTFIQYTENTRFEWIDESGPGSGKVALLPLGELMGGWQPPDRRDGAEGRGCRWFEESGHSTCYAFLEFFEANGGRQLFGLPISEFTIENDRIVQYFQFFRLDWYPEDPSGEQVRVAPLGRQHFRLQGYDPNLLRPAAGESGQPYRITELRPSASIGAPSVPSDGQQHVYLVVRDQNLLPVEGAAILLIAHLPSRDRYFLMPATDSQGVSQMRMELREGQAVGSAILEAWVMHEGLEAIARDSFTIR